MRWRDLGRIATVFNSSTVEHHICVHVHTSGMPRRTTSHVYAASIVRTAYTLQQLQQFNSTINIPFPFYHRLRTPSTANRRLISNTAVGAFLPAGNRNSVQWMQYVNATLGQEPFGINYWYGDRGAVIDGEVHNLTVVLDSGGKRIHAGIQRALNPKP